MSALDIFRMSIKEAKRLTVIERIVGKQLRQVEGARLLELSTRQIRRLTGRVRKEGVKGIIHRSRGRPSNRKTAPETRERVLDLCRDVYAGFGPTLASEKLSEREGIRINAETLRLWLNEARIPYERRKKRPHRQWRERKQCCGEMVQIDGSHHDWLEGRGPRLVLMGYIDDATGRVFARFYAYEGTLPVLDSFGRYVGRYGLPGSVYLDRHTTYKSSGKPTIEDELNNRRPQSQFERAMSELGVRVIHANSPQAKGRIERLFRTFQDRLIKEMRLEKVGTLAEANRFLGRYLPKHNRRFSVPAALGVDVHCPVPAGTDLGSILCIREERVVRNDGTVLFEGELYQIKDQGHVRKVTVERRTDGSLRFTDRGRLLTFKKIAARPPGGWGVRSPVSKIKVHAAPYNPWKQFTTLFYSRKTLQKMKRELVPV